MSELSEEFARQDLIEKHFDKKGSSAHHMKGYKKLSGALKGSGGNKKKGGPGKRYNPNRDDPQVIRLRDKKRPQSKKRKA